MGSQDLAYPPQTDYSYLADSMSEISLNILINSIAAASTLNAWDYMFVDIFSDADGASNTIDTGNTTAIFDTNLYKNNSDSDVTDVFAMAPNIGEDKTLKTGNQISAHANITISKVTKDASSTATHCYIYTDDGADAPDTLIEKVAFIGNDATFTIGDLTSGEKYFVLEDAEGATYSSRTNGGGPTFPEVDTNITWIAQYTEGTGIGTGQTRDPITIISNVTTADKIVQTNAIAITSGPTSHQVYCHKTIAGAGSVTYDISFDNGVTWITNQTIGITNTGSHSGTQMILKLNLNGVGAANTASANDYSILLAY